VTWKQKARHNLGEICVEREFKPSVKRRKRKKPTLKELNVKSKKSRSSQQRALKLHSPKIPVPIPLW
jgi:hypothetical protein